MLESLILVGGFVAKLWSIHERYLFCTLTSLLFVALKRSRGRLRNVLLWGKIDEKSDSRSAEQFKKPINWDNIGDDWNEMHKWRAFFLHMDSVLYSEGLGLVRH